MCSFRIPATSFIGEGRTLKKNGVMLVLIFTLIIISIVLSGRLWFRCEDVIITDDAGISFNAPIYMGENGRLLIKYDGRSLVTDRDRQKIGFGQGLWCISTPWFCLVSKKDPMLVPLGKAEDMPDLKFRGSLLKKEIR